MSVAPASGQADPDDAVVVIPLVADGTDQAALINHMLATSSASVLSLPEGNFWIGSNIYVPEGKTLVGAGQGLTVLNLLSTFDPLIDNRAIVLGDGAGLSDLTLDGQKVGLGLGSAQRICGVVGVGVDFLVENVSVLDITGYSFWAYGNSHPTEPAASGVFRDCYAENANVLFETSDADGVLFERCVGADGDGDILVASAFHPAAGSRNISFVDCEYFGVGAVVDVLADVGDQTGILFERVQGITTSLAKAAAYIVGDGRNQVTFVDSSFAALQGYALLIWNSDLLAVGTSFASPSIAVALDGKSIAHFSDSRAVVAGRPETQGLAIGIYAEGLALWEGGAISVTGVGGSVSYSGSATVVGAAVKVQGVNEAEGHTRNVVAGGLLVDVLHGTEGDDVLYSRAVSPSYARPFNAGLFVAPLLDTSSEIDSLFGGAGEDRLFAGYGDKVDGGAGFDTLLISFRGATQGVIVDFRAAARGGTATIAGTAITGVEALEWLEGSEHDDLLVVGDSTTDHAPIFGLGGDDHIVAGRSTGSTFGGDGDDSIDLADAEFRSDHFGQAGNDDITGGTADDRIFGGGDDDRIHGNSGSDHLDGGDGADILDGGAGNDHLDGGAGADQLAGGLGNDIYIVDAGDDVVTEAADSGTDEVRTALDAYTLAANVENLRGTSALGQILTGNQLANAITGAAGNDFIDGAAGADQLAGGGGDDIYVVAAGDVVTEAAASGTDEIRTALAAYTLGANVENLRGTSASGQILTGNSLDNAITGGAGNDSIDGGAGADQLAGGGGDDVYVVDAGDVVTEAADAGTDEIRTSLADYTLAANVENLRGTSASGQILTGNALANAITGGAGNDSIDGAAGADQLAGGGGNDVYVVDAGDVVTEAADAGTDEIRTSLADYTLAANVENLRGTSALGQILTGNQLANAITGAAGNDFIDGAAGADHLAGGGGDDIYVVDAGDVVTEDAASGTDEIRTALADYTLGANVENLRGTSASGQSLAGNSLDNQLTGGAGNDILDGGAGLDQLAGGAGNDSYLLADADIVVEGLDEGTADRIYAQVDYSLGTGVHVEILSTDSDTGTAPLTLVGNELDNWIIGNAGANQLDGLGGIDRLEGLAGDDRYFVDQAGDEVIEAAGQGHDTLFSSVTYALAADSEVEVMSTTDPLGTEAIDFTGSDFGNSIYGNAGANGLAGGDGEDWLDGGAGDDRLEGGEANDILIAGLGDDSLLGESGNDVFYFGAHLSDGDVADGGEGRDAIVLQGDVTAILSDTNLVGIESISLQSGSNARFGDTANNFYDFDITMADGNVAAGQQLIVNAQSLRVGEDFTFDGSAESDGKFLVYGGHGVDDLTGGSGADVFLFEGQRWGADDRVDGGAGRDALVISAGSGMTRIVFAADALTSIESISLNNRYATDPSQKPSYDLVLNNGNVAAGGTLIVNGSSISGAGQVVNIDGRGVRDGNLILFGGGGHDVIFGGVGADLIFGGGGQDSLAGGAGADIFRYDAVSDSRAGAPDLIGDFKTGFDKIDLSRIDSNSHADDHQAFTWIGSNAFGGLGAASAGELRLSEDGGYRRIEGDTDGNGVADLVIVLQIGTAPLVPGDFLL